MSHALPDILVQSRRGICPNCGAAVALADSGRTARCGFCGGESDLSYRLRKLEPGIDDFHPPVKPLHGKGATRWLGLQGRYMQLKCPGCGDEFKADSSHSIQTCGSCGTQSKLETRLVSITTQDVNPPQRRTSTDYDNQRRDKLDYPWEVGTEHLIWRVLHEPDLPKRVKIAMAFENWGSINHTMAHFLPWLLEGVMRDHDAVAFGVLDAVGKLLCKEDPTLILPVLQGCQKAVHEPGLKPRLLFELSLGPAVCVKLLLDAVESAQQRGDTTVMNNAMWGVHTLIGRNFPDHPRIAEVVLYRLFHLEGLALAWAINLMRTSYLRGRFPVTVLIAAIDELSLERPQVVHHLIDSIYAGECADGQEFLARVALIRNALAWGGQAAAAEYLGVPPVDDDALYAAAVEVLEPLLDDERALWSAERALHRLMTGQEKLAAPALHGLVQRRGEALSYRLKREFIRRHPDTKLLDTSQKYWWQSDPVRPLDPDIERMIGEWKAGFKDSVDEDRRQRDAAREFRNQFKDVDASDDWEGPATLPLKPEVIQAQQEEAAREQREAEQDANRGAAHAEQERITAEYMAWVTELMQRMPGMTPAQQQQASADIQARAQAMQDAIMKLWNTG